MRPEDSFHVIPDTSLFRKVCGANESFSFECCCFSPLFRVGQKSYQFSGWMRCISGPTSKLGRRGNILLSALSLSDTRFCGVQFCFKPIRKSLIIRRIVLTMRAGHGQVVDGVKFHVRHYTARPQDLAR